MGFTLGVFDVFGSIVPGAAYLALFSYVADRLHWWPATLPADGALELLLIALVSYVLGLATYNVGRWMSSRLQRKTTGATAVARFLSACPEAAGRPFVRLNAFLLLAKIQLVNRELAIEVQRVRASAVMLRGLLIPLALGGLVGLVEFLAGGFAPGALAAGVGLLLLASLCQLRAREMSIWAHTQTLEIAFWLPELDAVGTAPAPAP